MNRFPLIIPPFEEPLSFGYDRSSLIKFWFSVAIFSFFSLLGLSLFLNEIYLSKSYDREALRGGLLAFVLFTPIVVYQLLHYYHFKDRFLFNNQCVQVTNSKVGTIVIPWDEVEIIKLSFWQDEIQIIGNSHKVRIDESLPYFDLFLQLFQLRKMRQGGPIRREGN